MGGLLKQYGWAANLLFILLTAYFLAKIANIYVASLLELPRSIGVVSGAPTAPVGPKPREIGEYAVIVERNIFDSTETASDTTGGGEGAIEPGSVTGEAVKTSLPIKVKAIMMIGDGKDSRSSTTVDSGGGVDVYAVNDEKKQIPPGVRLVQVKPMRIEFVRTGRLEYAELEADLGENIFGPPKGTVATAAPAKGGEAPPTGEKIAKVGENKFAVDQAELDAALSNMERLFTEIRAVPNFQEGGKASGLKILSIKPGSIFAKLGLKRGDVLARINGVEIDIRRAAELFGQLKDQKTFNLDLQREGKNQTFDYEIR